jgi:hypothetical protein
MRGISCACADGIASTVGAHATRGVAEEFDSHGRKLAATKAATKNRAMNRSALRTPLNLL